MGNQNILLVGIYKAVDKSWLRFHYTKLLLFDERVKDIYSESPEKSHMIFS